MNQVLADRYRIETELGRGAAGVVHGARDLITDEDVAIKMLHADAASDPAVATAFLDEAEVLTELNHPGIVRPRDLIVNGTLMALVMDLVEGVDLRRNVNDGGPLPSRRAATVVCEVAEALAAVHAKDIIHGDVKPGNILIPSDGSSVRLVDFGVARRTAVPDSPTHATPDYTAPEIIEGAPSSNKSDVYGLGIVLYEALCGASPYRGGTVDEVLDRHQGFVPVRPSCVPAELWAVIEACLAVDPVDRPTAQAVPAMIRPVLPLLPQAPCPQQTPQLAPRAAAAAGTAVDMPGVPALTPEANVASLTGIADYEETSESKGHNKSTLIVAAAACMVVLAAAGVLMFAWLASAPDSPGDKGGSPQADEQSDEESEGKNSKNDKDESDSAPSDTPASTEEPSPDPTGDPTADGDAGGDSGDESGNEGSEGDFPGDGPIGSEFPDKPGAR